MAFADFNPATDYYAGTFVWERDKLWQFTADHSAGRWTGHDAQVVSKKTLINMLGLNTEQLAEVMAELSEHGEEFKRYGVSGIGQSASALTRIYDSVGMTAAVGTDTEGAVNDFDAAAPFMHRKCVGNWVLEGGRAKFNVQAYYGDSNFAEDGSMGDYVAVELPLSYYSLSGGGLAISAYKYPGYRPFDIFCRNHDTSDLIDKLYVPAYALALDSNGKAVSLPGYYNEQGAYDVLFKDARKYANAEVADMAMIMPAALEFYYWALAVVEFAKQDVQLIMRGAADMRSDANTRCKFIDSTHILVTDWAQAGQTSITAWDAAWRVEGDYVAILPESTSDINTSTYKATHKILSVTRCDATGTADASGQYSLIELEATGNTTPAYDYTGETDYKLAGRPHPTGEANSVLTPSGSPVSNSDGHHVMRYRYRENVWGNQYHTSVDLFATRVGTDDSDYTLEWYYLPDPTEIETPSNPNTAALAADPYEKLGLVTDHANYHSGYIISRKYDEKYPDIWIPGVTTGSATTYYADYAYLVASAAVRSVRFGGNWNNGGNDGFYFNANNAPSNSNANFGADLYLSNIVRPCRSR